MEPRAIQETNHFPEQSSASRTTSLQLLSGQSSVGSLLYTLNTNVCVVYRCCENSHFVFRLETAVFANLKGEIKVVLATVVTVISKLRLIRGIQGVFSLFGNMSIGRTR